MSFFSKGSEGNAVARELRGILYLSVKPTTAKTERATTSKKKEEKKEGGKERRSRKNTPVKRRQLRATLCGATRLQRGGRSERVNLSPLTPTPGAGPRQASAPIPH